MKKFQHCVTALTLAGVLTLGATATGVAPISANLRPDITITMGKEVQTMHNVNGEVVYPITREGTVYLPIRALGELLGQEVTWDAKTQTVHLTEKALTPDFSTVDAAEKHITTFEKEVAALKGAATLPERVAQYTEMSARLHAFRDDLDRLAENVARDFDLGKTDYTAYRALCDRIGAVETRLFAVNTALEEKTILAEDLQKPDEAAAAYGKEVAELEKKVTELCAQKPKEDEKDVRRLLRELETLGREVDRVEDAMERDLRGKTLTAAAYAKLNAQLDRAEDQLDTAADRLEEALELATEEAEEASEQDDKKPQKPQKPAAQGDEEEEDDD